MASVDRSLTKVVEFYRAGVEQFIGAGIAPPKDFVRSGKVSIAEAIPVLLELDKDMTRRVARDSTKMVPKAVRKVGNGAVIEAMLTELASIYGVSVSDFYEAQAMYQRGSEIYDPDQPMVDGDYDLPLLRSESEERVNAYVGTTMKVGVAFATIGDPRLARRISLVASVPGRLVWASMLRPHEIEELRYEDIELIWHAKDWIFSFRDGRRRAFLVAASQDREGEWQALVNSVREETSKVGFVWKGDYEGRRDTAQEN